MSKIVCPECGKIKGKENYCTECGYEFKIKKVNNISNNNKYIVLALTFLYLVLLSKLPIVISWNSGNLSVLNFVRAFLDMLDVFIIYKYLVGAVIFVLGLCTILVLTNKKIFASVIYLFVFIFQIIFLFILDVIGYNVIIFNMIILYVIPLIIFILLLINKKQKIKKNESDYMKRINDLKTLYDNKVITQEEFDSYKKEILDKEFK